MGRGHNIPRLERRWVSIATIMLLLLVGGSLRAASWLLDRDLWGDEAKLAVNIVQRSPVKLLEPLDFDQGAPVGYLLLTKLVTTAAGTSEIALRFLPFIGSLIALIAF